MLNQLINHLLFWSSLVQKAVGLHDIGYNSVRVQLCSASFETLLRNAHICKVHQLPL